MSIYLASVLTNMALLSFLALSAYLVLVVGEVSFGQQAFFGIGAYAAATVTAVFHAGLPLALLIAGVFGGLAALLLGALTARLSGLYFSIATLSFAELCRLGLLQLRMPLEAGGRKTGPDGPEGFENIRWVFENDLGVHGFLALTVACLFALLGALLWMERGRFMRGARMVGKDALLAQSLGLCPACYRLIFIAFSGAVAGFGGALFAHFNSYIEPAMFGIMLGVHGLAYSIIGGLGTPLGPLLGVALDIGVLESIRALSQYRMIVFGGLVALLLIFLPEGILGPRTVSRLRAWLRWRALPLRRT